MKIVCVSVVRDEAMYRRCFRANPHLAGCELVAYDNRRERAGVAVWYNRFLASRPPDEAAWYVFCHEDFELRAPLAPVLEGADPNTLWGPIGAVTDVVCGLYHRWRLVGCVAECDKDGARPRTVGTPAARGTRVETFDCQCLIVSSACIRAHALRFDEALTFDLYVEDFCIAAQLRAGVPSRILPLAARHWSGGSVQARYYVQEAYINAKYPAVCFTGTSSWILGGRAPWGRRLTVVFKRLLRALARRARA